MRVLRRGLVLNDGVSHWLLLVSGCSLSEVSSKPAADQDARIWTARRRMRLRKQYFPLLTMRPFAAAVNIGNG